MSKLHNIPAEHRLIGACLKHPETIDLIIDKIGPGDFSDAKLAAIFSAIARTASKWDVTPAAVVEDLRLAQELGFIGGDKAISWLLSNAGTTEEAKENAKVIRELARKRDQANAARRAADIIDEGGDPAGEIAELQEAQHTADDDGWTDLSNIVGAIIAGTHKRLEPTLLKRTDGECLIYPARLNLIAAPPESMKSWIAKLTCVQQMIAGYPTVYIDCEENDGVTCTERIFSIATGMGISQETIRTWLEGPLDELGLRDRNKRLFYYKGDTTGLDGKTRGTIMRIVKKLKVPFVVIDGFAAAMSSHTPPLEEDKARDVNLFLSGSVWPIVNAGAGVLVVDHVTKNSGGIGQSTFTNRGPRGSGAKLAAVSGVALRAQVTQAGSAWQAGRVEIHVDKDRPGRIKIKNTSGKRLAGVLVSNPSNDGIVEMTKLEILSPEQADQEASEKRWDLIAAEKISNLLNELNKPMSKTEIKETLNQDRKKSGGSGWRAETIVKAIDFLVTYGWVRSEKEGRHEMLNNLKHYNAELGATHASDHMENPF
jgi:hypothetical protein